MLAPLFPRMLLAALLLFGSEILLWSDPLGRPLLEWLLLIPAYCLTATLLLDIAARFRIRDLFDVMLLAGIYGLLASALLNPAIIQAEMPVSLIARGLGAHTLLGLEMLGAFLVLTGGRRRRWGLPLLAVTAAVGLAWGTWVRWSPLQTTISGAPVLLPTALLVLVAGLVIITLLWVVALRQGRALTPESLLLKRRAFALVIVGLLGIFALRVIQLPLDPFAYVLIGVVFAACLVILWFRRLSTKPGLLIRHLPPAPPPAPRLALLLFVLLGTGVFAYSLPSLMVLGENQLLIVTGGFLLYGVAWLPFVCGVLGINAYARQLRTRPM